ncbi:MAG: hypothetical protein E7042_04025 [Lentisphaerae bacterium]|nr:hypothetical protein [Lentisphaerota bacterium]
MARDRFISDNLYNMRERFRRNHAEHLSEVPAENSVEVADRSSSEPVAPAPAPAVPAPRLPSLNSSKNGDNREKRELEGCLLRDLSFIEAEKELISNRSCAMENFRKIAEELLDELNQENLTPRQTDLLRIKYFQAYGRFEAAVSRRGNAAQTTPVQNSASPASWPIIAAISGAAILISLTLFLLFGR